ncbi:MAG: hypothetical protein ACJ79K_09535 [Gemmatimonadaceae bacterium]
MRKMALLIAMVAVAGCGGFKKTFGIKDAPPAHSEPKTTSIYGDWILANPDSTAFAGARAVELSLHQTDFTITATYPSRPTFTVTGGAAAGEGLLTLTPTMVSDASAAGGAFVTGRPIVVVASAAGGSLVFAPPPHGAGTAAIVPSSVWHKKAAAQAAGAAVPTTTP